MTWAGAKSTPIYVSDAVKLMEHDELLFLLQQSREKNLRLGITGMLLYKQGNFMQLLEGEKHTVMELYDTIGKDDRHKHVTTVMTGDIKKRNFGNWSMGFLNMDKAGILPRSDEYVRENRSLRSFQNEAQEAYRFMVLINELNP